MFWVDLAFEWYKDALVFCVFIFFLFRTNIRKGYFDESIFCHCYGNFVESAIKSWWITTMFKVLSQKLQGTLKIAFWKKSTCWRFYEHESRYLLRLSSRLEQTSQKENQGRCLENYYKRKYDLTLYRTLHQSR